MSKISAIRVDRALIKLLPHDITYFGRFFDIDSISLLLGTNGSGKTRMLISIANSVSSAQDDSFQFYFQGTPNGNYEPSAPYNKSLCTVYYSALPYKRKLVRKRGVLDASPGAIKSSHNRKLEKFGEIADILGINTQLTGFLEYTRAVFRAVIIPELRSNHEKLSGSLKEILYNFNRFDDTINTVDSGGYKEVDKKREFFLNEIESFLENESNNRLGKKESFLFLSSLEYLSSNVHKRYVKDATLAFLNHIGIIEYESPKSAFFNLYKIVENTKRVLDRYCKDDFEFGRRKVRFNINDIEASREIGRIETPIQIEWLNQSSGLQALVEQFSSIDKAIEKASVNGYKSVLLLIDEGDAFLHLEWQRRYISILNKFLGSLKHKHQLDTLQLIMASHSPLLAADIPGDFVTSLDSDETINSFAAPMDEVISGAFSSNSIGEFAANKINEIYKRAIDGKITQSDKNVIEAIGDVAIKSALKRRIGDDY